MINELVFFFEKFGIFVIGCYNFIGILYLGKEVFFEVVYLYGL